MTRLGKFLDSNEASVGAISDIDYSINSYLKGIKYLKEVKSKIKDLEVTPDRVLLSNGWGVLGFMYNWDEYGDKRDDIMKNISDVLNSKTNPQYTREGSNLKIYVYSY